MAVKAKITAAEFAALSTEVQAHYGAVAEGHHLLDVTSVDGLECVDAAGLKSALASERDKAGKAEKAVKDMAAKFTGLDDPEAARKALQTVKEIGDWDPDKKLEEAKAQFEKNLSSQYEGKEKALLDKHVAEIAAAETKLAAITTSYKASVITSNAMRAITEAGGSAELLLPIVERQTRMKENDDGKFTVEVFDQNGIAKVSPASGNTSPMTIAELVAELKADETYGRAFDGSGASGSGSSRTTAGPGGIKVIDRHDVAGMSASIEDIATGKVQVQ